MDEFFDALHESPLDRWYEIGLSLIHISLTVNVARLRKKLENAGMEGRIKTKKGIGYYLDK